ncbi:DUF2167 domain-containing protein [Vibrio rotiferianus]|jgi:uncharacterized membrane-anchored protein|uniref:DUF2167 domain-containing protein n=1 Tax=Vibrio rotiferianus TaxID=190895 RepID=UPI00406A1858
MKYITIGLMLIASSVFANPLDNLNWEYEGIYDVPNQNATIRVMTEQSLVRGEDAAILEEEINGVPSSPNAVVLNQDLSRFVITESRPGFIKMDDWEESIDSNELLQELIGSTEKANKHRKGTSLFIDGWVEKPTLNKKEATMYYAVRLHSSENEKIVNARALKLSREGYSQITWVGSQEQFISAEDNLAPILEQLKYKEGHTYKDFVPDTDTVAAFGAGALMYKLITGKVASKGGLAIGALLLTFGKKLWFLIFFPFVWLKNKLPIKDR